MKQKKFDTVLKYYNSLSCNSDRINFLIGYLMGELEE